MHRASDGCESRRGRWISAGNLVDAICNEKCGCGVLECEELCREVLRVMEHAKAHGIQLERNTGKYEDAVDTYVSPTYGCTIVSPKSVQGRMVSSTDSVQCNCRLDSGERIFVRFPVLRQDDVRAYRDGDTWNLGFASDTIVFSRED